ncbi:hypothetical protein [[Clostridium] polysaccharolyticum]|uniref:Uncharacterized protein n=1 Tax=[Clostridium] polysaccharolyticum TaxID=29364 RepID=A0A1I0FRP0_9FIRM|nr:hypothetical protein [[Clostridium] polysaccharolyticum]SET60860.1 hypothetical protein SAMN04487772_13619 [[Clostridium] polysaccharolyticum]
MAYFAISMACGLVAFGWKSMGVGVKIVNGNVCQINQYVEIGRIYMIFAIKLVFYIILTMITVIFLRKGVFALLLSSIVLFANNMIESFISINVLNNILPFRYLAMSDVHNAKDLFNMAIVLFTYSMILLAIARKKFEKSDLV